MRSLPTKRNPHIAPESAPKYDELLKTRRLGRTKLSVKPGQIGTSNATKAENLGPVEYAHLRAPLPENLEGSEIFATPEGSSPPETYFFMRRSKDGFVSATGMFKIAFPWATHDEEKAEREHLKSKDVTSEDEIAGNIWITPEYALDLASDYGLSTWIRALLDPSDISPTPNVKKGITEPPKFELPAEDRLKLIPTSVKTPKSRSKRSVSPAKASATPQTKSPKKRQTKAQKEAALANANAASASLQSALDDAASVAAEDATPSLLGEEKVTVEVDQAVEVNGDTEVTHTNVSITMPAGLPELPLPEDTEAMLEKAKQMVEEAKSLESAGSISPKIARKRKAEEAEASDIDKELPTQPAKKAKVLEEKLKREKVRNRAIVGVTAMLGIAAAIPYFF